MSLNDEVFDELGVDIKGEKIVNPGDAPVTNVINTSGRPSDDVPVTPVVMEKITDPATKFKSVSNGVESVTSMEKILTRIDVKNAISFADAEEVNMMFENFQAVMPLNGFTERPSMVGLRETKTFLKTQIRLRKESVGTELENLLTGPSEDQQQAFEDYRTTYGAMLGRDLAEFAKKATAFIGDERKVKGQTFEGRDGNIVNLLTDPLDCIDTKSLVLQDNSLFLAALANLQVLLKDNMHFRPFFMVAASEGKFEQFLDDHFVQRTASEPFSLGFLLLCFATGRVQKFLDYLEEGGEQAVTTLRLIEKQAQVNPGDFNQVRDFVVKNTQSIDEANGWIHYYVELSEMVRDVHLNMTAVLEFLEI